MSDVVVTVPKRLWAEWLDEGDLAYADDTGHAAGWAGDYEYGFNLATPARPRIGVGDRVYIVAHGRLRGYAPLVALEESPLRFGGRPDGFALVRRGQAVACTIAEPVRGFQGWRYRWWERDVELPFADWRTAGVPSC